MANFFKDNDDLRYYFEKGIDWKAIVDVTEVSTSTDDGFASTEEAIEFYRDIAEMVGEFVAEESHRSLQRLTAKASSLSMVRLWCPRRCKAFSNT